MIEYLKRCPLCKHPTINLGEPEDKPCRYCRDDIWCDKVIRTSKIVAALFFAALLLWALSRMNVSALF